MKIRFKKGKKFKGDRIFSIETNGEEFFTHARLMILINALADNEYKIYKEGDWDKKGMDFLYEYALIDAIKLGKEGKVFIDEERDDKPLLKEFCERNKLMKKFNLFKQTLLNEFEGEDGSS